MQSNFEVLGVRASTYEFEGDTAGYCQIYPSLLNLGLPLIPCMSSGHLGFNHGMFNEDHFDNCYHNIHLTNTGIALLDFFSKALSISMVPLSRGWFSFCMGEHKSLERSIDFPKVIC